MTDAPAELNLKPATLAAIVGGGVVVGTLIVIGAILPAEYNVDPLGLGRLTGIGRIWAPEETRIDPNAGSIKRTHEYATPFRTDTIEIPLGGFLDGAKWSELEYKVAMKKDATLIYSWEVAGAERADDFRFDFHGHTLAAKDERMTVATYKQSPGLSAQGALTAPFDGIQGWQFSNLGDKPVVVKVRLAGFYDLVPAGAEGNLAGIQANVPAAAARPDYKPKSP